MSSASTKSDRVRAAVEQRRGKAEPVAKALLLDYLRQTKRISRYSVVSTELILAKHSVRVDVALSSSVELHCFEIKTAADTLARLDKQVEVYARHADFVTVVAASKHINAVLSRVPDHVGIYEMLSVSGIRVVREPRSSPTQDPDAMLSLLPVEELKSRFCIKATSREQALSRVAHVPSEQKKAAVLAFLGERYKSTTKAFLRATRRRMIVPADVCLLRRWSRTIPPRRSDFESVEMEDVTLNDEQLYTSIGSSFGPVPPHVLELMAA